MTRSEHSRVRHASEGSSWKLQDAKARFSQIVRLAQERGPQRVSVHGRDAVVIVAAAEFDRLQPGCTGGWLVECLADPRLAEFEFERLPMDVEVRNVEL